MITSCSLEKKRSLEPASSAVEVKGALSVQLPAGTMQ